MSQDASPSPAKALLLVESNVEDAFAFSRAVKASELRCDFYTVSSAELAKRYLIAGSSDVACVPATIVISMGLGAPATADLMEWIRGRDYLRTSAVFVLLEEASAEMVGWPALLSKPVSGPALRRALMEATSKRALASKNAE